MLPRYIGVENALDLLLSGRTVGAAEAKALGLVSRVLPADEVLGAAQAYARELARYSSPRAMAVIKRQVLRDLDRDFDDALRRSYAAMHETAGTAEASEGVYLRRARSSASLFGTPTLARAALAAGLGL